MIRLIELFSGIGAQAKALELLGIDFEHYKTCDWEVNATKSYHTVHSKDNEDYSELFSKEELVDKLFDETEQVKIIEENNVIVKEGFVTKDAMKYLIISIFAARECGLKVISKLGIKEKKDTHLLVCVFFVVRVKI